jgi:hypothetical protein
LQKGYAVDRKYNYKAIAEEDAKVHSGTSLIKAETTFKGQPAYRVLNEFKDSKFVSVVSKTGEVLQTLAPLQKISTELVKSAAEATAGFKIPQKSLGILFGSVPVGNKNVLHKSQAGTGSTAAQGAPNTGPPKTQAPTPKPGQPKTGAESANKAGQ